MQRQKKDFKRSTFTENLTINPEDYAYYQACCTGAMVVFCQYLIYTSLLDMERANNELITFTVSVYFALYFFENSDETVSFKKYKIDYKQSLGKGFFGEVYALVPRPENEQGYLSNLFPYIYDYYFPVITPGPDTMKPEITEESEKYCVKIYNPRQYFIVDHIEDKQSNRMLIKHKATDMKLYSSNCLFSQIKTRIHGKTLCWHMNNHSFIDPEKYIMREKFVLFYRSLLKPKLLVQDLHTNNIMYDERKKRWEIIDGVVTDGQNENIDYKFFSRLTRKLRSEYKPESFDSAMVGMFEMRDEKEVFISLRKFALSHAEYTKEKDAEILNAFAPKSLVYT